MKSQIKFLSFRQYLPKRKFPTGFWPRRREVLWVVGSRNLASSHVEIRKILGKTGSSRNMGRCMSNVSLPRSWLSFKLLTAISQSFGNGDMKYVDSRVSSCRFASLSSSPSLLKGVIRHIRLWDLEAHPSKCGCGVPWKVHQRVGAILLGFHF